MTTRNRVAHTASFLQTFHTGQTTAARRANAGAEGSEPRPALERLSTGIDSATGESGSEFVRRAKPVAAEEARAVGFVTNRPVRQANAYTAKYRDGIEVLHGDGLITEPQAKYVISIALEREGVTEIMLESLKARLAQGFAKYAASQFINTYKDLPRKAPSTAAMEAIAPGASTEEFVAAKREVEDGRYALRGEDGVVKFYRVQAGKGQWTGFTFVKVQASDDLHNIRNKAERERILAEIAKDPEAAEVLYGQELGRCYRCNRTLTDETSRDLGIGPDCRAK